MLIIQQQGPGGWGLARRPAYVKSALTRAKSTCVVLVVGCAKPVTKVS